MDYPQVTEIAKKRNVNAGQVLISWGAKRGYSVIPKSVTNNRITSNFQQIELSDEEYQAVTDIIKTAGKHVRYNTPYTYTPKWDINVFGEEVEKNATHQIKIE